MEYEQALEALRRQLLTRKGRQVDSIDLYLARALVVWQEQHGLPHTGHPWLGSR